MSANSILPLKSKITYGPVNSRRLGVSLGINLLPPGKKYCTFNCLYCQYGPAGLDINDENAKSCFPAVQEVMDMVKTAIEELEQAPDYLTFSGHGEPTLFPDFAAVVDGIRKICDEFSPNSKIALFTNGTRLSDPEIKKAILGIDVCIVKLDCATEALFRKYNLPNIAISLQEIVNSMKEIKNLTIQALFTGGNRGNYKSDHIKSWIKLVREINPVDVQIYSLSRGYASREIESVNIEKLRLITNQLNNYGISAQAY